MERARSAQRLKRTLPFLFPEGLVLLAAIAFLRPGGLPSWSSPLIEVYAYAVLVGGVIFGWYAKRTRILWSVLLLGLADRALQAHATATPTSVMAGNTMFDTVAFLLPLNFLGFSLCGDHRSRPGREAIFLVIILMQAFFAGWLSMPAHAELAKLLETSFVEQPAIAWTSLPQPALLAFAVAIILLSLRFAWTGNRIDKGFVWALVACFIALQYLHSGWNATNYLATASLVLILATYAESHRGAYYDSLTAMPGRTALDQALFDPGARYTIALLSIDGLKEINLKYGYVTRDEAVRSLGRRLAALGKTAKAFRYAEDSFAILYPDRTVEQVLPFLQQIRERVQASPILLPKRLQPLAKPEPETAPAQAGQSLALTVSIGVAERTEKMPRSDDVLAAAEKHLLRAKRAGGNHLRAEGLRDSSAMGAVV